MFDELINEYGRRLFGLCRTLCAGSLDPEELYQETWLKAIDRFSLFDSGRPFEPWLTGICVNTYRDMVRRRRLSPIADFFASGEEKDAVLENIPAPEKDDISHVRQAVDNLPEKLRVSVILFYYRDMDIKGAAKALGVPEGTVKSRLSKARKLLKEVLDETDLSF